MWWADCTQDVSCTILRTGCKEMGTSAPGNWKLTVPKATKIMLVRPLMTNWTWLLEVTVLFLHITSTPPPKSVYDSSHPLLVRVVGGIGLWTAVRHSPSPPPTHSPPKPQLPASEIKQNFLSIHLGCLLAFERSATRPPCMLLGNSRASAVVVPPTPIISTPPTETHPKKRNF